MTVTANHAFYDTLIVAAGLAYGDMSIGAFSYCVFYIETNAVHYLLCSSLHVPQPYVTHTKHTHVIMTSYFHCYSHGKLVYTHLVRF